MASVDMLSLCTFLSTIQLEDLQGPIINVDVMPIQYAYDSINSIYKVYVSIELDNNETCFVKYGHINPKMQPSLITPDDSISNQTCLTNFYSLELYDNGQLTFFTDLKKVILKNQKRNINSITTNLVNPYGVNWCIKTNINQEKIISETDNLPEAFQNEEQCTKESGYSTISDGLLTLKFPYPSDNGDYNFYFNIKVDNRNFATLTSTKVASDSYTYTTSDKLTLVTNFLNDTEGTYLEIEVSPVSKFIGNGIAYLWISKQGTENSPGNDNVFICSYSEISLPSVTQDLTKTMTSITEFNTVYVGDHAKTDIELLDDISTHEDFPLITLFSTSFANPFQCIFPYKENYEKKVLTRNENCKEVSILWTNQTYVTIYSTHKDTKVDDDVIIFTASYFDQQMYGRHETYKVIFKKNRDNTETNDDSVTEKLDIDKIVIGKGLNKDKSLIYDELTEPKTSTIIPTEAINTEKYNKEDSEESTTQPLSERETDNNAENNVVIVAETTAAVVPTEDPTDHSNTHTIEGETLDVSGGNPTEYPIVTPKEKELETLTEKPTDTHDDTVSENPDISSENSTGKNVTETMSSTNPTEKNSIETMSSTTPATIKTDVYKSTTQSRANTSDISETGQPKEYINDTANTMITERPKEHTVNMETSKPTEQSSTTQEIQKNKTSVSTTSPKTYEHNEGDVPSVNTTTNIPTTINTGTLDQKVTKSPELTNTKQNKHSTLSTTHYNTFENQTPKPFLSKFLNNIYWALAGLTTVIIILTFVDLATNCNFFYNQRIQYGEETNRLII